MVAKVVIEDSGGSSNKAKVTSRGELVVGALAFSNAYNAFADTINTAYNLVTPKQNKQFIITSVSLYANKNVGVNDATVVLYEASSPSTTTVDSSIISLEIPKNGYRDITGINLIVSQGKWVNVKTDDDDVYCTILGYYAEADGE